MSLHRVALAVALVAPPTASACGFVESAAGLITLREDAVAAHVVLYGTLANARKTADGGTTDFVVSRVVKSHPAVKDKDVIKIDRFISIPDPKAPPRFLVFADVKDGKIDPYRGDVASPALVDYVAGGMRLDPKDRVGVMKYAGGFLEHADPDIAADAFNEFLKSADADIRTAGRGLSADRVRSWLRAPTTKPDRLRLYAFLLAQCGTKADAPLLRELLDRQVKVSTPPMLDGVLTAYTLLDRTAGWAYTLGLMKDPTTEFYVRYAGLRAARYFHTTQPDALPEADRLTAVSLALGHADMADLPVTYLREWKCWKLTAEVLALADLKGFEAGIIQRAVTHYAVACPDPRAAAVVVRARKKDPEGVADLEDEERLKEAQRTPGK